MTLNNPTKKLINLIDKYKLVDVAKKFGLLDPTWYGRGSRSHLNSVVDYAFCSNNVIVQEAKYFVTARSDHVVLCFSNKKTKKNIGAVPNERLFLSNDFSKHATAKLHECHENFTLAYPSILHEHDSDYFINWLETLSTCLDHVNMEYHAANFVSIVNKERCFRYKFLKTLKKLSNSSDKEELDKIKEEHLNDIEQQIDLVKKRFRIKAAQSYGRRSTSFAFANFKSKSDRKINSIQSIDNPGMDIFDPLEIVDEFSKFHQKKTSAPDFTNDLKNASIPLDTKNDPISYIFKKFNLSFDNFFPSFPTENLHIKFTESQIKETISSMKNFATPGLSNRGKLHYLFLFNLYPSFFTNAINQLILHENLCSPNLAWIKNRKIIFIPKKNKEKNLCEAYRPISLLEVLYKIISKLLISQVTPFLDEILLPTQFGFTKNRTLNQASFSILQVVEELMNHEKYPNASIIFCDMAAAFDSVLPMTINKILKHIFPNSSLPEMIHALCSKGIAYCDIAGHLSKPFNLEIGSGQGDPASSCRFNLIHHLYVMFVITLQNNLINETVPIIPGSNDIVPTTSFADDTTIPVQFSYDSEVETFLYILSLGKLMTGLSINPSKTQILTLYCDANNLPKEHNNFLKKLGQTTNSAIHLGLIVE